jgi:hypothetical protein
MSFPNNRIPQLVRHFCPVVHDHIPHEPLAVLRSGRKIFHAPVLELAARPTLERYLAAGFTGAVNVPRDWRIVIQDEELKGVHVAHELLCGEMGHDILGSPLDVEEGKVRQLRESIELKGTCQTNIDKQDTGDAPVR